MRPTFVSVFLGGGPQNCCEVPVTPETLCRDVLHLCMEPGENRCCLTERWRGNERIVGEEEKMTEVLQRWGQHTGEVSYLLRRLPPAADRPTRRGLGVGEDDEVLASHRDTALSELKDLVARQQLHIEVKQHLLASKEQHLWRLRHEDRWETFEEEHVQRLRDNASKQEAKLRRVRALRGQVELKRISNRKLASEVEHASVLFQRKQTELLAGAAHAEELSKQLEALGSDGTAAGGSSSSSAAELERLRGELQVRNRLSQEHNSRLQRQKDALSRKNQEVATVERRVAELRLRLCKKKAGLEHKENTPVPLDSQTLQHATSKVAAVGPYIRSPCQGRAVPLKSTYPNGTAALPLHNKVVNPTGSNGGAAHTSTLPRVTKLRRYTSESDAFRSSNGLSPVPARTNHTTEKLLGEQKVSVTNCKASCTGTFPVEMRASAGALHSYTLPLPHKQERPPAAAVRPYTPEPLEAPNPPEPPDPVALALAPAPVLQKPQTVAAASIYSMYTLGKSYQSNTLPRCQMRVYGKPALQGSGGQQSDSCAITSGSSKSGEVDASRWDRCNASGAEPATERDSPRPLSPTKLLPFPMNTHRNPSDADPEATRRRQRAPRPLKKRGSVAEAEGPAGSNIQKLLFQKTTLAAMETILMETAETVPVDTQDPVSEHFGTSDTSEGADPKRSPGTPPSAPPRSPNPISASRRNPATNRDVKEEAVRSVTAEEFPPYPPPPYPARGDAALNLRPPQRKKSILRTSTSVPADRIVRVKFNPLAVLLDASLEGEYDLVQRVVYEVDDPSGANDEGITALHNAVCAGHADVVRFLIHFGVDVNAADSDGWTPLHCAASCNNVDACKFLVESGAAVLAVTHSDERTAADKCEEMDDGYAQCSHFLYGVQEKMGVTNRGTVYGLWDYEAQSEDELSFKTGDCLTVLRQDEQADGGWWWACCGDRRGFVPRNLLGLYPRIRPRHRSLA
ncbi:apoptosis-stimulating of p53 protein 2-like isoform X2 [Syngnathoides biaculeatus]|uniref:apoptosis-stimulating of p53 protein 2-like isoform X2 n=1 Tax=Syngnathoides biaculeatus TaxID=300417 RepID=UPI002ADE4D63|nr:apoptosis-stimulating of p53 protein 2-like isoform X2 [Syngnathoides biaculeatus]